MMMNFGLHWRRVSKVCLKKPLLAALPVKNTLKQLRYSRIQHKKDSARGKRAEARIAEVERKTAFLVRILVPLALSLMLYLSIA